jgi:hypothetical protein
MQRDFGRNPDKQRSKLSFSRERQLLEFGSRSQILIDTGRDEQTIAFFESFLDASTECEVEDITAGNLG